MRLPAAVVVALAAAGVFFLATPARADDAFDAPFARAVRSATSDLRLLLWARSDDYVQSTEYVPNVGVMYTNHERFNPPDLAHPTVLVYDQAGRLAACEY